MKRRRHLFEFDHRDVEVGLYPERLPGVGVVETSPFWTKEPAAEIAVAIEHDGAQITDRTTQVVVVAPAFLAGVEPGGSADECDRSGPHCGSR
jgi:hypothetical protein